MRRCVTTCARLSRDNFYAGSYNIQDGSVFITLDGGDRIYSMILAIRHLKVSKRRTEGKGGGFRC